MTEWKNSNTPRNEGGYSLNRQQIYQHYLPRHYTFNIRNWLWETGNHKLLFSRNYFDHKKYELCGLVQHVVIIPLSHLRRSNTAFNLYVS